MHYGFVPNHQNLQSRFTGYTENPFTFKQYLDMMKKFHVHNELSNDGYKTKEDCFSQIKNIMEFNGSDPDGIFYDRNRLFIVSGKGVTNKTVVTTDTIYEYFNEVFYGGSEVYKTFSDFYRLCSKMSVGRLYNYFNKTSDFELFAKILGRIHEIWDKYNISHMSPDELYEDGGLFSFTEDGVCKLWTVLDEATQLELYMASTILHATYVMNQTPLNEDFYAFDVR